MLDPNLVNNATYDDNSDNSSINTRKSDPYNIINSYSNTNSTNSKDQIVKKSVIAIENEINADKISCKLCANKSNHNDSYIILSCNHMFHIYCLADNHYNDNYRLDIIGSEYFSTRKCPTCEKQLQTEELMFLHSKFLSYTKGKVESHQQSILCLETQFNKIKEELRICYEYKQKLDNEREKSKQIVTSLMTLM